MNIHTAILNNCEGSGAHRLESSLTLLSGALLTKRKTASKPIIIRNE